MRELSCDLPVVSCRASGPGRTASAVAKQPYIYFQLINRAAQGVAVHPELTRRATLIAFVLLQDRRNKTALKFAYRFGIKDIAAVHLLYQRFKLIFHGISLSMTVLIFATVAKSNQGNKLLLCRRLGFTHVIQAFIKLRPQLRGRNPNRSPANHQKVRSQC